MPYHSLQNTWVLYYHNPEDTDWSKESYTQVIAITTVEEFWALQKTLPEQCLQSGMFFIMKKGILPIWEDPHNKNGGCWSYKISLSDVHTTWKDLTLRLIIDKLCTVPNLINGISISPKKGFCVIKIWNNNHKHLEPEILSDKILALNHQEAMFIPFKNK